MLLWWWCFFFPAFLDGSPWGLGCAARKIRTALSSTLRTWLDRFPGYRKLGEQQLNCWNLFLELWFGWLLLFLHVTTMVTYHIWLHLLIRAKTKQQLSICCKRGLWIQYVGFEWSDPNWVCLTKRFPPVGYDPLFFSSTLTISNRSY